MNELHALMQAMGQAAVAAAGPLSLAGTAPKNHALRAAATALRACREQIISANADDMRDARDGALGAALLDRLQLDEQRVEAMARGLDEIAQLADPIGCVIAEWTRPNGLCIQRVRVPLGVIGIIYESRPNVTADAGALCLKSGNAAILRGGSESRRSNAAIHACLLRGLEAAALVQSGISHATEPHIPRRSLQPIPTLPSTFWRAWTVRSCCTMPRRSSPTAVNSEWARK